MTNEINSDSENDTVNVVFNFESLARPKKPREVEPNRADTTLNARKFVSDRWFL